MSSRRWRRQVLLTLTFAWIAALIPSRPAALGTGPIPPLMLWAWERAEDLRQLPSGIGVAFLAQTFTVDAGAPVRVPRRQPLRVGPHIPLVAVTRIETPPPATTTLSGDALMEVAAAIAETARLPGVTGVQIDFDAPASLRPSYAALIHATRRALPADRWFGITALASWCAGDDWIGQLPVDEVVPMLFRMGRNDSPYVRFASSPRAAAAECRHAVGMSLDEPRALRLDGRRLYLFAPAAWTPGTIRAAALLAR